MKKKEWINIPRPRFPLSFKYFINWLIAPIKPYLFSLLCKIRKENVFLFNFNFFNFFFRWGIKLRYLKSKELFEVSDVDSSLMIKRKHYMILYAKGIKNRKIALKKDYHLDLMNLKKDDVVIDVGACIGEVSKIISEDYGCKVLAIEPELNEFKCLNENLKGSNIKTFNLPLWSEEKKISFYSSNELRGDSSCFETEDYTHISNKQTLTLNNLVKNNIGQNVKIKLLKLEAEGAEPEILLGGLKVLPQITYISADVGPERGLSYDTTLVQTVNILKDHGFELIKMGHPRIVCLFKNKKPI